MISNFTISKLTKNYLGQLTYSNDFLLKFPPLYVSNFLNDFRFNNVSSAISMRNVAFKNKFRLLRLIRVFEPLQYFNFKVATNYRFKDKTNGKAKLFFNSTFSFLCNIIDFYDFFLLRLTNRSRTLTRSFVYKDFLQINFYEHGLIGLLDQRIDYYGWNEPLVIRIQMCQTTLKKKTNFEKFLLNHKNYFVFFVLKVHVSKHVFNK